jgi:hypothetical protein
LRALIFAVLLTVVVTPGGRATAALVELAVGDAYYIGHIDDGTPAARAAQVGYINHLITLAPGATTTIIPAVTGQEYDRIGSTLLASLPLAELSGSVKNESGSFTNINVEAFSYILGKYASQNGGTYVWYVPSLSEVNLPAKLGGRNNRQHSLSHYSLLGSQDAAPVPDSGATLMLLGSALVAVESLRRKLRI